MGDNTKRRAKPEPTHEPDTKTIGPETYPAGRTYTIPADVETFAPKAGTDVIPQEELASLAEDEKTLADMDANIKARKAALVERLRAGAVGAPGVYVVAVKTNMKPQRVEWKQAFVDATGDAEAKAVEAAAKGGPREVSSYGLELKRADGGK